MSARAAPSLPELGAVTLAGIIYFVWRAIRIGKGLSWDQENYHYYNAYAWLSGRMDYYLAPAGQHSWINPLLYLPHYWIVNHLPPVVAGAVFASWLSLNFVLIYLLGRLLLANCPRHLAIGLALICAIVGLSDPLVADQIGTTDSDGLLGLPVLAALCALAWAGRDGRSSKQRNLAYGAAGVLLGAAAGLKWTCLVYAVGMTAALLLLWRTLRMDKRLFLCFAAGGVAGYLPSGGYWNWLLWSRYQNPFFPYWNRYFRSPWAMPQNFRDMRFPPGSLAAALSFPFQWFAGLHPTSEGQFRIAVFAFLSVLIPVVLLAALARRWSGSRGRRNAPEQPELLSSARDFWLLLVFAVISYAIWVRLFAIQRYLMPVSFLSGLLLWLVCDYLLAERAAKVLVFVFLAAFSVLWMQREPDDWRIPYGSAWFGLELPAEMQQPDTLFVMLGDGPVSYVVPFLPESARAVRLTDFTVPENGLQTQLARHAQQMLAAHTGPMRSISAGPLKPEDLAYLRRFGLELLLQDCQKIPSDAGALTTCPIVRLADGK